MQLKLPVVMDRYHRNKDRSYSLTFVTDLEMSKEQRDMIDEAWQSQGWLLFSPNEIQESDIPKDKAEIGRKSPSEILFNRMVVSWKERGIKEPFDTWRASQLEKIGEQYLNKIKQ